MLGPAHDRGIACNIERTVHVTETAGFSTLSMMQTTGPVDGDISRTRTQLPRTREGTAGVHGAEVVHV